jgi:hypothetical protein
MRNAKCNIEEEGQPIQSDSRMLPIQSNIDTSSKLMNDKSMIQVQMPRSGQHSMSFGTIPQQQLIETPMYLKAVRYFDGSLVYVPAHHPPQF